MKKLMFKICPDCDFEWNERDGDRCPVCSSKEKISDGDKWRGENTEPMLSGNLRDSTTKPWVQALAIVLFVVLLLIAFGST